MKNPMIVVLFLCAVAALVRAGFRFYYREWFPAAYTAVIASTAIVMLIVLLRLLNQLDVPLGDTDFAGGRIVMQATSAQVGDTLMWALGFFLSSVGLVEVPDALWTKWISYPAAFVLLLLMGLMLLISMGQKLQRVEADSSGIQVFTETRGFRPQDLPESGTSELDDPESNVKWAQVGAVRLVRKYTKSSNSRRSGTSTLVSSNFVLLDHNGKELLSISEPLAPPDRYKLFLESIPRWTGHQVEEISTSK